MSFDDFIQVIRFFYSLGPEKVYYSQHTDIVKNSTEKISLSFARIESFYLEIIFSKCY